MTDLPDSGSPIAQLDAETIGQIAAGEIIERPVSIVKELVENAVDSGARRIAVAVDDAGVDLIEVRDDGSGMAHGDLRLAIRRHATSKLRTASDLERIGTLGFRGEGLASIAAVARLEIISRKDDEAIGARIVAFGESSEDVEPAAAAVGTCVRVTALFERVPVRREYLRSASAEFNRVSTWLAGFALGYPQITFTLRHGQRNVWIMPASDDPQERLAMVFGDNGARGLLPLRVEPAATLPGTLRGFISAPGVDRPDRRMQLLFVNGRMLRSTMVSGAWTAAYTTFAMSGRHPYGVLFIDLPPDHVDANVHPTKSDVRLRYGTQVFDAVRRSISATLHGHASGRLRAYGSSAMSALHAPAQSNNESGDAVVSLFDPIAELRDAPTTRLRVLEQLNRTFIVASDGEHLVLVDQHAAHERIAYESIVARARSGGPSEPLLVPLVFELDGAQSTALDGSLQALQEGGMAIESFGQHAYRIVATPAGYGARPFDFAGFIDDLTADPKQRDMRERTWASLACHSVTVAGERLEMDEMTTLIERLARCVNPMHCPHGRPTMTQLDPGDIARMFKRV